MTANELRIGNYIKLMLNHEDYETFQVTSDELVMVDKKQADYEPLRLTEEWLLKFGFEKDEKNEYWFWKNCVSVSVLGYIELLSFNRQSFKTNIQLKYIHQLQNLYFALTGKELVVSDAIS
jgi:hypothetical protein